MDSPICLRHIGALVFIGVGIRSSSNEESDMNATTVAVDLAKSVFKLAVADSSWKPIETHRLTRAKFERWINGLGIEVRLLPAQIRYMTSYTSCAPDSRCLA